MRPITLVHLLLDVVLIGALAVSLLLAAPAMRTQPFSAIDRFAVLEQFPGGHFAENDSVYVTCEHGQVVRRYADGAVFYFARSCWR